MDQDKLNTFIQKAQKAGYSSSDINKFIAQKQETARATEAAKAGILTPGEAYASGVPIDVLSQQKEMASAEEKQPLISSVSKLLGRETKPITGRLQIRAMIPGAEAAYTKNLYNQLKSQLALDNISALKGTGAISDKEFQVLASASTALDRNLSDKDFRAVLNSLKEELSPKAQKEIAKQAETTQPVATTAAQQDTGILTDDEIMQLIGR